MVTTLDSLVCEGDPVDFKAITENCGDNPSFRWYLNNGFLRTGTANITLASFSEGDSVFCLVQTTESCLSTNTVKAKSISVNVQAVINLSLDLPPAVLLEDSPINLQTKPIASEVSGNGVSGIEFNPQKAGTGLHKIQAIVPDNACSDTLTKEILVCDLRPTNLVIRSGEASNRVWTTERPGFICSEQTQVNVYNRWGKEIKSFENYLNDWDASDLIPGAYFYKVSYSLPGKSQKIVKSGHFTIIP
jgi:hypothetical protein